ncbi:hypothetical protein G6F31_021437 [Rhizopus arrhizus]|nr:hypothetical protein G6F31_021437 [Rhizopus arrhizus]
MLAIVQRGVEIAMEHAAGAPARRVAGFEDGDLGAGFAQGDACRQPRPACADNRRLHRANRRTSPRPPPTQVFHASHSLRSGVSEMRWCSTCQLSRSISSSSA